MFQQSSANIVSVNSASGRGHAAMGSGRAKMRRRAVSWALAAVAGLAIAFSSAARAPKITVSPAPTNAVAAAVGATIAKDGEYTSKDEVAQYIRKFKGALPRNFITKREARALGWSGGPLERFAPGKSIGGDRFGNYERQLPPLNGSFYKECDIDTKGRPRGAKRLVFTQKGNRIYYTQDHYKTFTEVK